MAAGVQGKGQRKGVADKCLYANCIPVLVPEIMHTAIRRWVWECGKEGFRGTVVREVQSRPVTERPFYERRYSVKTATLTESHSELHKTKW
jgi:hypothetical protein